MAFQDGLISHKIGRGIIIRKAGVIKATRLQLDDEVRSPKIIPSPTTGTPKVFGNSVLFLLVGSAGAFVGGPSMPTISQAADLSSLPQEVKTAFAQMKESEEKEKCISMYEGQCEK